MPNQDGRGPEGKGPKTGRGLGTCDGAENTNNERGAGLGRGRGGRRGGGQGRNFVNQEK